MSTTWLNIINKRQFSMIQAQQNAEILDLVFSAISDSTRRSILDRLRHGSLTVTELAEPYGMSLNAVSKHIKTLEKAGLIKREIHGREHTCRLDTAKFEAAMDWMSYYTKFWTTRLDALEVHLKKNKRDKK